MQFRYERPLKLWKSEYIFSSYFGLVFLKDTSLYICFVLCGTCLLETYVTTACIHVHVHITVFFGGGGGLVRFARWLCLWKIIYMLSESGLGCWSGAKLTFFCLHFSLCSNSNAYVILLLSLKSECERCTHRREKNLVYIIMYLKYHTAL